MRSIASRPSRGAASGASIDSSPSRPLDLPARSKKKVTSFERGKRSRFFIQAKKEKIVVFSCLNVVASM
jgi:hypothetical protein